jgi:spermidine/putrescine transport system substrate-binding protein
MKILFALGVLCCSLSAFSTPQVNVCNWAAYIPPRVITLFEKQTGIHVNYSTFDNNHALYTKLKSDPHIGYDVVFPSTYFVQRLSKEHMLMVLNHKKLSHFKDLNPRLLNRTYDPHNRFDVPFLWGSTGIIVNDQAYNPSSITTWRDLWQKRFRRQLLLTDDMRDVFAVGMHVLGYSINDTNPAHIKKASLVLQQLLPNVKLFNSAGTRLVYLGDDASVGMIDSGDAYFVIKRNPHLHFIYPKDGVTLWMDCMAIPIYAPHPQNAYKFINFILKPKIAKMISEDLGYSTPNLTAQKQLSKKEQENVILNPPKKVLARAQMEADLGKRATRLYLQGWERLKLSA